MVQSGRSAAGAVRPAAGLSSPVNAVNVVDRSPRRPSSACRHHLRRVAAVSIETYGPPARARTTGSTPTESPPPGHPARPPAGRIPRRCRGCRGAGLAAPHGPLRDGGLGPSRKVPAVGKSCPGVTLTNRHHPRADRAAVPAKAGRGRASASSPGRRFSAARPCREAQASSSGKARPTACSTSRRGPPDRASATPATRSENRKRPAGERQLRPPRRSCPSGSGDRGRRPAGGGGSRAEKVGEGTGAVHCKAHGNGGGKESGPDGARRRRPAVGACRIKPRAAATHPTPASGAARPVPAPAPPGLALTAPTGRATCPTIAPPGAHPALPPATLPSPMGRRPPSRTLNNAEIAEDGRYVLYWMQQSAAAPSFQTRPLTDAVAAGECPWGQGVDRRLRA